MLEGEIRNIVYDVQLEWIEMIQRSLNVYFCLLSWGGGGGEGKGVRV